MKEVFVEDPGRQPLVSVLISLYNYDQYIVQALDSVAAQTLQDIELIVCDDCSTDHGAEVTRRWMQAHSDRFCRMALIANDINSGLAATRNTSAVYARAPFLFILDADNFIFPSCLERSVQALADSADDVAFVFTQRLIFNDLDPQDCLLGNLPDWNIPLMTLGNYIDAMVLHKADALRQVGWYTAKPPFDRCGWEDFELWFKYIRAGLRGIKLHQPQIAYRVHGASMLHTTTDRNNLRERLWKALKENYAEYFI